MSYYRVREDDECDVCHKINCKTYGMGGPEGYGDVMGCCESCLRTQGKWLKRKHAHREEFSTNKDFLRDLSDYDSDDSDFGLL